MKSYIQKLKEKHDEYLKYKRNPVPIVEARYIEWMNKDILLNLLDRPGRYAVEVGFRGDGVVVWRESTKPQPQDL